MRGYLFCMIGILCITSGSDSKAQEKAPQTHCKAILDRYRQIISEEELPDTNAIRSFMQKLIDDGSWSDINYQDDHPAGWKPNGHLVRIRLMSRALITKDHSYYNNAELKKSINRAIDYWLEKRYVSTNWFWNVIGVPQNIRDILILLDDQLDEPRREKVIAVLGPCRIRSSGANFLWTAELAFHRACILNNENKIAEVAKRIWNEIKVGGDAGIQPDGTFYQHGKRVYVFAYGKSFLSVVVNIASQLQNTPWEMPAEKRMIISNYLLDGMQWMSRGKFAPPGTIDRVFSSPVATNSAEIKPILRRWAKIDSQRSHETEQFLKHQEGATERPLGFKYFPYGELAVFHCRESSIFLRVISERTSPTETTNGENQKGVPYLHNGDHYVVRDGKEFNNLQPVLKWTRLPGLTIGEGDSKQDRQTFVGGTGDGTSGMATMDYVRSTQDRPSIALHKTWFFHGEKMLCLICPRQKDPLKEIELTTPIVTTIEQCRLQGNVTIGNKQNDVKDQEKIEPTTLQEGNYRFNEAKWILHNNVCYFPIDKSPLDVYVGKATGSWSALNKRYNDKPNSIIDSVLRVEMPHRSNKVPGGFVVMLGADQRKINAEVSRPDWRILQNDYRCQAIQFQEGLIMAAFYEPGKLELHRENMAKSNENNQGKRTEHKFFEVDQPCLAMWDAQNASLCDPTLKGKKISITWNGKMQQIELPPHGEIKKCSNKD